MLFFVFKKCDKKKRLTCKSDDDIKKWLETRYLIIAYNKYTFIQDGFDERTLMK